MIFEYEKLDAKGTTTDLVMYKEEGIVAWQLWSEVLMDWVDQDLGLLRKQSPMGLQTLEAYLAHEYQEKMKAHLADQEKGQRVYGI